MVFSIFNGIMEMLSNYKSPLYLVVGWGGGGDKLQRTREKWQSIWEGMLKFSARIWIKDRKRKDYTYLVRTQKSCQA